MNTHIFIYLDVYANFILKGNMLAKICLIIKYIKFLINYIYIGLEKMGRVSTWI